MKWPDSFESLSWVIKVGEGDEEREFRETALKSIESVKWYLWHGNVFQALEQLESLSMDLESADFESPSETTRKLLQAINELHNYVSRFPATEGGCMTPRNLMLSYIDLLFALIPVNLKVE
jgi:hypothetical protein